MSAVRGFMNGNLGVGLALLALTACGNNSKPRFVYMPDMAYSPALKSQEPGMRMPPVGTVPRGFEPLKAASIDEAGPAGAITRAHCLRNVIALGCWSH
jgi:hypothetical protein